MPAAKRMLGIAFAFVLVAVPAFAHPPGVADEDQAAAHEVEALREFVKRAIEKRDAGALRALYHDRFTHTHASGRSDGKDARIAAVMAGDPAIETAPVEELNFSVFGDHTIVVTGKSPLPDREQGRAHHIRWLSVYVKIGADWKIVASQETRLP